MCLCYNICEEYSLIEASHLRQTIELYARAMESFPQFHSASSSDAVCSGISSNSSSSRSGETSHKYGQTLDSLFVLTRALSSAVEAAKCVLKIDGVIQ